MSKTILLVEDDNIIRETMRDALEFEGYQIVEAQNGKVALDLLKTKAMPDLILLDMQMPVLDGRGFLDAKVKDENIKSIPVIVVSATAEISHLDGSVDFIRKPLDLDKLITKVSKYVIAI